MARVFTDQDLLTWEAYSSAGRRGLPLDPRIVFNCLSAPDVRARFVVHDGEEAEAGAAVRAMPDSRLRELLAASQPLE
ncbi:MAG TPA: hypothetical protein VFL93_10995 [Longimicrobiaceae bacterium]|nr:hypothetical protein [Longimicrobiaceae bacterium]